MSYCDPGGATVGFRSERLNSPKLRCNNDDRTQTDGQWIRTSQMSESCELVLRVGGIMAEVIEI